MLRLSKYTLALVPFLISLTGCTEAGDALVEDSDDSNAALALEARTHGIDLTDEEAAEIRARALAQLDHDSGEIQGIVLAGPGRSTRAGSGVCLGISLPDHVRQKHVGKTDEELIKRSQQNGGTTASSWKTDASALRALKNLIDFNCDAMLRFTQTAPVGASGWFQKTSTGETGRACYYNGVKGFCRNVLGATALYTKYFQFAGFTISYVTTAYPIN